MDMLLNGKEWKLWALEGWIILSDWKCKNKELHYQLKPTKNNLLVPRNIQAKTER